MPGRALSRRIAFCGLMSALMLLLLLAGSVVPLALFICPALAGMVMIAVHWEYGTKACAAPFAAVCLLGLFLAPDKEPVLLYLFLLGWYPVLQPAIAHRKTRAVRIALRAAVCTGTLGVMYALMLFVLGLPDIVREASELTVPLMAVYLIGGNLTFLLYDVCLRRVRDFYVYRLRPRLFRQGH